MKSAAWFRYWIKRALTRPRVILRSVRNLGAGMTIALTRIRLGSAGQVYSLKIPPWQHPIYVRGGTSTDAVVLYELLVTKGYRLIDGLQPPATIIDGGANIGLASVEFLNRYPKARVIAVEPFAETFKICQKNLAEYGARATAIQGAIWSSPGRVRLDPQGEDWANKVTAASGGDDAGTAEAYTMPMLIEAAGGFVDLLKIDVEGSELEIFARGAGDWLPFVGNIVIELHGRDCVDRFFQALAPYDYELSNVERVYFCMNLRLRPASHGTSAT